MPRRDGKTSRAFASVVGASGPAGADTTLYLNTTHFGSPAKLREASNRSKAIGWSVEHPRFTPAQNTVVHEWGHLVDHRLSVTRGAPGVERLHGGTRLPLPSLYASETFHERFAENFVHWAAGSLSAPPHRVGEGAKPTYAEAAYRAMAGAAAERSLAPPWTSS